MDPYGLQEVDGVRTRSFRDEGYNNRRVFLRSYPLHWGSEDDDHEREQENKVEKQEVGDKSMSGDFKKPIKKIILSIIHWGEERAIMLKRFKNKVTIYVIVCYPVGFKTRTAFISS